MSSEDVLVASERSALRNEQIVSRVVGKRTVKFSGKKAGSFGAVIFITAMLAIILVIFNSGNLIPTGIMERLVEETDMQYADAVESKLIVLQQALMDGDLPENTAARLKENGVLVGYESDGGFVESNKAERALSVSIDGKVITAGNFVVEANNNAKLYNAINNATYGRAAYYYDDSASEVFRKYGTRRNDFSGDEDFEETLGRVVGDGTDIDVNGVTQVAKTRENDKGETEVYYEYEGLGGDVSSEGNTAEDFIAAVNSKSGAADETEATMNAANTLNTADKVAREQQGGRLYIALMENISKMKAGEGNNSQINKTMNYLHRNEDSYVVDVETGEVKTVSGSMMESPDLYAILSGNNVDQKKVQDYSSDRVLNTVQNQIGAKSSSTAISDTVTSSNFKDSGTVGRFTTGEAGVNTGAVSSVTTTINNTVINGGVDNIKGVAAGELLVEGAMSVGKELAKASGGSVGDADAAKSYARLNSTVIALEAQADRLNRSPFDITSKNTFLGSIIYNMAISLRGSRSFISSVSTISRATTRAVAEILPATYADDESDRYLANFGECETLSTIGAVGSAACSEIITFDTSTLGDIFSNGEFTRFIEENTTLEDGVRKINNGSVLANYILYNNSRNTPAGVSDGGILAAINGGGNSIPFVSDIIGMVKNFVGATDAEKRVATNAEYVNSASNAKWQESYKYAQRYVSLARATEALRKYDGDQTAYSTLKYFEGTENPVIAFIRSSANLAQK